jgi:pilus assembly protein Flp/PilA
VPSGLPERAVARLGCGQDTAWITIVKNLVLRFLQDESAATAIEYGLVAAGISLAIIAVVSNIGTKLKTTFSSISTQLH